MFSQLSTRKSLSIGDVHRWPLVARPTVVVYIEIFKLMKNAKLALSLVYARERRATNWPSDFFRCDALANMSASLSASLYNNYKC